MCYEVILTPKFESDIKFYIKKRKYTNITNDIQDVINELENGNFLGNAIPNLKINTNEHTYKVRVANTNTNVGKSNGYRLIYYVVKDDKSIFLLTIYYKKDDNDIPSSEEIAEIINEYCV